MNSDFVKAHVDYLGYTVGQGKVKPLDAKMKDIMLSFSYKQKGIVKVSRVEWLLLEICK